MVKIAKNKSSNSRKKKKGESTAVTEKKGKKKQSLADTITEEEFKVIMKLHREECNEEHRKSALIAIENQERRKMVEYIEEKNLKKRLVALGYVFIPTEGLLVDYYLRNKNVCISMYLCPIEEVDVYAYHPQALAGLDDERNLVYNIMPQSFMPRKLSFGIWHYTIEVWQCHDVLTQMVMPLTEKHPNTAEVWHFFTRGRPNEIQAGHDVHGQWVICEKNDVFNQGEKVGVKLLLEYCEGGHKSEYKIIEFQLDPAPENLETGGHWFICKLYNGGCVDVRFRP